MLQDHEEQDNETCKVDLRVPRFVGALLTCLKFMCREFPTCVLSERGALETHVELWGVCYTRKVEYEMQKILTGKVGPILQKDLNVYRVVKVILG